MPVFADIEAESFNLDPRAVASRITSRTRALLPVHLFGRPAAMGAVLELAERYGLAVIEDAAQAFGAQYLPPCAGCNGQGCQPTTQTRLHGRYVGTLGTMGAFSFYPSKNLGAYGDGGLIVTNDARLAERARKLRSHGSLVPYQNEMLGYNSRLDGLQAAILRVKLPYVTGWNAARRRLAERYTARLASLPGVTPPAVTPGHVFPPVHRTPSTGAAGRHPAGAPGAGHRNHGVLPDAHSPASGLCRPVSGPAGE
jgi:dTDP-4-amino-4,6-dideoxygalactose transaminase